MRLKYIKRKKVFTLTYSQIEKLDKIYHLGRLIESREDRLEIIDNQIRAAEKKVSLLEANIYAELVQARNVLCKLKMDREDKIPNELASLRSFMRDFIAERDNPKEETK